MFTDKEIRYMKSLGLSLNFNKLTDDDYVEIEDVVGEKLQKSGFDIDYGITTDGEICESILDKLA